MIKQTISIISLLLMQFCSSAQELNFNHLKTENGLSQNSIFAITQDERGFMWFGSRFGLNRYDGHQFQLYKSNANDPTTLSDDYITALHSDNRKVFWVGTANGLNRFDPKKNTFERIYLDGNPQNKQYAPVNAIYEDRKGNLWVASRTGLYLLTNRNTNTFTPSYQLGLKRKIANSEVLSIFEDHQGYLWVGTNSGLSKLSFNGQLKEMVSFNHQADKANSLSDNSVTAITEDPQQNLWVATENAGINLFHPSTNTFSRFSHEEGNKNSLVHNSVRRMNLNKAGNLCIGTQEGLSILDPVNKKFKTYQHLKSVSRSLNQNSIYSIYEDGNGSLWIGTYYGGVNVAYAHDTNFKTIQYNEKLPGISHNVVSSIIADKNGNLWIGTEGGGLNYLDLQTKQFTTYKLKTSDPGSLGSDLVKVIYKDKGGDIWVGTHGGGLNLFDPYTHTFKRFLINGDNTNVTRSELVALLEDQKGAFWTGSQTGIRIFTKQSGSLIPYPKFPVLQSIQDNNIKVLFEDSKQNIWIASTKGLFLLSSNRQKLQSFKLPKGSNSVNNNANYINCIQEDAEGNIWVGLYYGGLSKYDRKKKRFIKNYTTADGLPNNNVVGILEDDDQHLWISTSNGLARFNPKSQVFLTYTTSDGLAGDEFNYNSFFKAKNGDLYFGGYNGLSYFSPKDIEKNSFHAPLVFTGLKLFNEPVQIDAENGLLKQDISFTDQLTFPYRQNIFTIEFALLNFIKSDKNKYAYRLEGVNGDWVESCIPGATYTNLASGNYTLWVKGANNDGIWSSPVPMKIRILPPFWKSWWAYGIYLIIFGMMLFFITRFFYLRGLLLKDEELHQIKLNFFTNISHEIRTHLTLIMAPIEKLIEGTPGDSQMKQQLNKVKNNADRLLKLVNELMDFRKAETKNLKLKVTAHDFIPFIQEIYSSFEELSIKKNIGFSLQYEQSSILDQLPTLQSSAIDQAAIFLYFDKEQLEKVFFNLLSNAFKFTPEGGQISIEIKTSPKVLKVSIRDTGRGIAPEYLEQLFENYFQVEDHQIQNTGYGIGLALSKHIVALHKGNIEVYSLPEQENQAGFTCFELSLLMGKAHFPEQQQIVSSAALKSAAQEQPIPSSPEASRIPAATPPTAPLPTKASVTVATTIPAEPLKKQTILVVEDHAELRHLIKESLEDTYRVLLAENGKLGWETAIIEIPDLIISDVMMPEMDGFTLCNQLKIDERTNHIPLFLLTAKSSQTDQISGLSQGADLYLSKPFSTKILQLHVRNFLAARDQLRKRYSKEFIQETNQFLGDPKDELFLSRLIGIIESHMEQENFGVDLMAEKIGMSQSVLYKKLKALTDLSVNDFAKSIRLKKAAQLLLQNRYTVYEVGYMVGFSDRKYFSREFKKQFSKTPSEYIEATKRAGNDEALPPENK